MTALLLLDVDGTLGPFEPRPGYTTYRFHQDYIDAPMTVNLSRRDGPRLLAFAARHDLQLTWATRWNHQANELISPRVGLPRLPTIDLTDPGPEWKYPAVAAYADGRALAWLDDALRPCPAQDRFLSARRGIPTLLRPVFGGHGIRPATDLVAVAAWRTITCPT